MRSFILASLVSLAAFTAWAQEPPKPAPLNGAAEVDTTEILRRGDMVAVSGEGPRDAGELLFSMAMSPPADDSDMWNIAVFGKSTDAAMRDVVKAFETDANLAPFIAMPPGEGKRPWAHFNVYHADDPMQKWRFNEFQIPLVGPFPVVILSPPRDGSFGGIVNVTGKDGKTHSRGVVIDRIDAKDLGQPATTRKRLTASVRLWTEKLAKSGFIPPAKLVQRYHADDRFARSDSHGQQPAYPWGPSTPPQPTPVMPQWPPAGPAADPTVPPGGGVNLLPLLALFPSIQTILLFLTAASNIWLLYRDFATKAGIPMLVDDATFKQLKELLDKITGPSKI